MESSFDSCPRTKGHISDADFEYPDEHYTAPKRDHLKPQTVFVEVLVAVDKDLIEKIGETFKDGRVQLKSLKNRPKSEIEEEVKLYVRKFMSAVNVKFQGQFSDPRIKFSIAFIIADPDVDTGFESEKVTGGYNTDRLDVYETKIEMGKDLEDIVKVLMARQWKDYQPRVNEKEYDIILALSGRKKFNDIPEEF